MRAGGITEIQELITVVQLKSREIFSCSDRKEIFQAADRNEYKMN